MFVRVLRQTIVAAAVLLAVAGPAHAQLKTQLYAQGFDRPLGFVQDPSDPAVQIVFEQGGHVKALKNGVVQSTDFLDLSGVVLASGEMGLLGFAFAPDYGTSGRIFVNFIDHNGNTVVARFQRSNANPLQINAATRFDFIWPGDLAYIAQPFANHKGGNIAFGPDGYLYIGLGDGGSGGDPFHNSQKPSTLLGKMLRLNVSVPDNDANGYDIPANNPFVGQSGVLGEIWAFGLRNPWRWSFDDPAHGGTGAIVIADVGQGAWEEVDYEPAGTGGRNYGWRNREGAHAYDGSLAPFSLSLTDPIHEYSHADGQSITGGVVYRGTALGQQYVGRYFFADFGSARLWSLGLNITPGTGEATAGSLAEYPTAGVSAISSFGTDANGEIYLVYYSGTVHRLLPVVAPNTCGSIPDPFAALGGGTCVNGGWLPPGMTAPGSSVNPPSPPSAGGCSTADPFAGLGGGTCSGGNWYPPGITPPGTTAPSPPSPPAPSQGSGGCTTSDPFAEIGGGTCSGGGWYPPGIPPPSGGQGSSSPPSDPPSSPPSSPPGSGGCATPDPFATIGGGTCSGGGWYPPGITPPSGGSSSPPSSNPPAPPPGPGGCTTSDPFVAIGGGTCFGGNWFPPGITPR